MGVQERRSVDVTEKLTWVSYAKDQWDKLSHWSLMQGEGQHRKRLFSITYLGRTHVAFGGGKMRWGISAHPHGESYLPFKPPEFHDLDEAKAWATTLVVLS